MTKPDLTNTAPKRIYLDIGDQFALERVASGDLRWDLLDGVTWSEDNATSHGIPYVRADLVPTPAASGAAPAEVQRRAVDGIREFYLGLLSSYLTTDQILRVRSDAVTRIAVECNRDVFAALASREASPALADEFETWVKRAYRDAYEAKFTVYNMEVAWHAGRAAALASPQVAPAPKPLDDPRLQRLFGDAIEHALSWGILGSNAPAEGHWLVRFWNIGRAESTRAATPVQVAPPETAILQMSEWFKGHEFANVDEMQGAWEALEKLKSLVASPVAPQDDARDAIWVKFEDGQLIGWDDVIPDGEYFLAAPREQGS